MKISDAMHKIVDICSKLSNRTGFLIFNGHLISKPKEVTFKQALVHDGDTFLLNCGDFPDQPVQWVRFLKHKLDDYCYMNTYPDAVAFVPKRKIIWYGFGLYANYHGKEIKYKVQFAIDDEEPSDEFEITRS